MMLRAWLVSAALAISAASVAGIVLARTPVARSADGVPPSFSHALPRMAGDRLRATVVEVPYGPGESSRPHSHPCPVIAYVVEGAIRTRVKGEPEAVYRAGQSFYEAPNGVHVVSANASATAPAKLVAFFVCDRAGPLLTTTPGANRPGR